MSENAIARIPDMGLAQELFTLLHGAPAARDAAKTALWAAITKDDMAPFYSHVCEVAKIPVDAALLAKLEAANTAHLESLAAKLKEAEESAGETEISDALIATADYLAKIGEKEKALSAYRTAFEKTPGVGAKIDLVFSQLRIGLFYGDREVVLQQLEKAKGLIEKGGDWDRRNRCKVYEATFLMSQRDFKAAAALYLETLATFTSTELMDMKDFISYTVIMSVIALPRTEIKAKLLESPEVLEVVHQIPHLEAYMRSLYECKYNVFFQTLAHIEQVLKANVYLHAHYPYYVREMRILGYAQLLESYRSLTLEYMASAFGVSQEFIDRDLYKFISGGRLNCVIDKVRGIVETNRPDAKNAQYQSVIKQGDLLLNRVQKLSRVINI
ncbi:proteasome regulatory particle subunit [Blastocladiella emersonii ATCC 22665]|nr:proteasome regulatory particle subunit [Blastocladiella emersonii ATCC 22665]